MKGKNFFVKIRIKIRQLVKFLSVGIWKMDRNDGESKSVFFIYIIKTFILTYRNINITRLFSRASALTYSTLLSIVPMLAVFFSIANGFGFPDIVKEELSVFFKGQEEAISKAMEYIQKSIEYAHEGIFLGIGLVLLFYSVLSLLMDIENSFNKVWGITKGRSFYRIFTDYMALLVIAPIFLIVNAGIVIFLSSVNQDIIGAVVVNPLLKIAPFILTIFLFTFIYIYIPNTKVKFSSAFFGGIFAGISYQIFQMLYISGQIWISKYNAIYGSFAVLPLLLLWLQITWILILVGLEISFASQNISKYDYEYEIKNISTRYKGFVLFMIASLIIKRFAESKPPYTQNEISKTYKIPTRLNYEMLNYLEKVGIIEKVITGEDKLYAYAPAIDINLITVNFFFKKIMSFGSENFPIETDKELKDEWDLMLKLTDISGTEDGDKLLKDL